MRIGLLIDGSSVTRWQADALEQLTSDHQLVVYSCTNSPTPRRQLRHWPYYLLNLISLRSDRTRRTALPRSIEVASSMDFQCLPEGAWQRLPDDLLDRMANDRIDVVIKFGLGLLRIPDRSRLPIPILSYHHGDPRHFRGRPAGFYELLRGHRSVGQIVQILSNRLDSGKVVAFAETRIHRHSYRATMRDAYTASPLLLPKALAAVREERTLDLAPIGEVTRLPSPWTVMRFMAQGAAAKVRRFAYGAFVEKQWQVAEVPAGDEPLLHNFPSRSKWRIIDRPPEYRFLADPFPHPTGDGLLVEALRASNGLGEILHISKKGPKCLLSGAGHFSYPATIVTSEGTFLVPEVCEWSTPLLYRIDADGVTPAGSLKLDRPATLVDPTLTSRGGRLYLFANIFAEGDTVLRLWSAPSLRDRFDEHPASPVLISPKGARMGGMLFEQDGSLYRVGQDGSGSYGDGILIFRVEMLGPTEYRESMAGELRFEQCRGPHTLNYTPTGLLFDYYHDRFDVLAGVRRLRSRLARRS